VHYFGILAVIMGFPSKSLKWEFEMYNLSAKVAILGPIQEILWQWKRMPIKIYSGANLKNFAP